MSSSIGVSSSGAMSSTTPPSSALHPLYLLEHYLDSQRQQEDDAATAPAINVAKAAQDFQDEILRVADFLYGSTLDGALALLDNPTCITKVVSIPSQRSLYTVRGQDGNSYLCLLPDSATVASVSAASSPIFYCSCRSFLEKSRNNSHDGAACLCKHLLALELLLALQVKGSVVLKTASDDEFGSLILNRMGSR